MEQETLATLVEHVVENLFVEFCAEGHCCESLCFTSGEHEDRAYAIAKAGCADKHWRQDSFDAICKEYIESLPEEEREAKAALVKRYYGGVNAVGGVESYVDKGVGMVVVGEEGAKHAVYKARGEDFVVACAAFALEEASGEAAGSRELLPDGACRGCRLDHQARILPRSKRRRAACRRESPLL